MTATLIFGDCMEKMKDIPDGSIDLILCDPPFGLTRCRWDSALPLPWMWEQYRRVLTDTGTACIFGVEPFSSKLRLSALDLYKYDWIWSKPYSTGFLHCRNMPMRRHEVISVFSKGSVGHKSTAGARRMTYNPQGLRKIKPIIHRTASVAAPAYGKVMRPSVQKYSNWPDSILEFPHKEPSTYHPNQKPQELLEYLVRTYTDAGGGSAGQLHGLRLHRGRLHTERAELDRHGAQREVFPDGCRTVQRGRGAGAGRRGENFELTARRPPVTMSPA